MRKSQLTGRLRLRHLLETTEAAGEEMDHERKRFARLADPENAARAVSSHQLFQTPPTLAARLALLASPLAGRVLEPSAGLGRIYEAVRGRSEAPAVLVERSPDCCRELYRMTEQDDAATLIQADFLECTADRLGGLFARIVMNPPFKNGSDIRHIKHALTLLEPGGRLVAICANGPRQRRHLQPIASQWHDLPEGSFKSEGTNVNSAIFVFDSAQLPRNSR